MLRRRVILAALAAASFADAAQAQGAAAQSVEAALNGMTRLLDASASAIAAFAADLARPELARPVSRARAREASEGLVDAYREINALYIRQTTSTAPALDAFADTPTAGQWAEVKARLGATIRAIASAQETLELQEDAFAVTPLYAELQQNLASRAMALEALADLPPPKTAAELKAYRGMVASYKRLLVQMEALRDALRVYAEASLAE